MNAHTERIAAFRRLHDGDRPFLLPNAWDHASAAALAEAGFPAIGTTSLGVAAAAGRTDGTDSTRDETLALALAIGRLPCLVTVDVEGGFSERPEEVAELAARLAAMGVVGLNIEDGRDDGSLMPAERQCQAIAAVKARVPELFVNARTDTHWLPGGRPASLAEAIGRARAYAAAGADGIFVPGVSDEAAVAALVAALEVPLNVLYAPGGPTLARLAELGVRRVSCGSLLFRMALHTAVRAAVAIAAGEPMAAAEVPSYATTQALASER
jgi:2-methylisocitrate lyase-like PEP mutase family enzyme